MGIAKSLSLPYRTSSGISCGVLGVNFRHTGRNNSWISRRFFTHAVVVYRVEIEFKTLPAFS